jgi:hypothetical protein
MTQFIASGSCPIKLSELRATPSEVLHPRWREFIESSKKFKFSPSADPVDNIVAISKIELNKGDSSG